MAGGAAPFAIRALDLELIDHREAQHPAVHSGQHLLDWLEAGGRTGRSAEDVRRERAKKNAAGTNQVTAADERHKL